MGQVLKNNRLDNRGGSINCGRKKLGNILYQRRISPELVEVNNMPYQVTTTPLDGVLVLEPKVFGDARGFFYESFNISYTHIFIYNIL